MSYLDMKIRTVVLLPGLQLDSLHLLSGNIHHSGHTTIGEAKERIKGWLGVLSWSGGAGHLGGALMVFSHPVLTHGVNCLK